jgi:AraC-like DNA-binding protein
MTVLAPDWVDDAFPYYQLVHILNFYLDVECWIIPRSRLSSWHPIRYHNRGSWPVEFDDLFGRREARSQFNRRQMEKVIREKKTSCASFDGFDSFFVPILRKGEVIGILQSGVFIRRIPSKDELIRRWKKLTRSENIPFNPDFFSYVRCLLESPLVAGPVYRGFKNLLEVFASVAAGETEPQKACREAERLRGEVFARHLPNRFWMDKTVKNNRVYPPDWWMDRARADRWRKEEQGIERPPTVVIAVMVEEGADSSVDDLETMLRNHRFQKSFFELAKKIPNTVASPLEDYGMVFFTSTEPGQNEIQAKLEILDWIDRLSKSAQGLLGARIFAGVARCFGSEQNLSRIFREAVSALGFCRPLSRPTLFYEDIRHNPTIPKPPRFYELSKKLVEVYSKAAIHEIEPTRSNYIEQVLAQSSGRPEIVRLHFLFVFTQLVEVLRKKAPLQSQNFFLLFDGLEQKLQQTAGLAALLLVFRESLKKLFDLSLIPARASQTARMEAASRYMDERFSEDLTITAVAKAHGFSVSVFAREFKKETGASFSTYLRKVRVEQAKRLLTSTHLSIAQISQESGFNNLQYFFDVFKRLTGQTPGEIRASVKFPKIDNI